MFLTDSSTSHPRGGALPKFKWLVTIYPMNGEPVVVQANDVFCNNNGIITIPGGSTTATALKDAYKVEINAIIEA